MGQSYYLPLHPRNIKNWIHLNYPPNLGGRGNEGVTDLEFCSYYLSIFTLSSSFQNKGGYILWLGLFLSNSMFSQWPYIISPDAGSY